MSLACHRFLSSITTAFRKCVLYAKDYVHAAAIFFATVDHEHVEMNSLLYGIPGLVLITL